MGRTIPFHQRYATEPVESDAAPETPVIVRPDGQPARVPKNTACPQCGAAATQRVPSSGFGDPHDICQACGFEFTE